MFFSSLFVQTYVNFIPSIALQFCYVVHRSVDVSSVVPMHKYCYRVGVALWLYVFVCVGCNTKWLNLMGFTFVYNIMYIYADLLLKRRPSVILVLTCPLGTVQETALEWDLPCWRQRWPSLRLSASSGLCCLQRQRWVGVSWWQWFGGICTSETVVQSFQFLVSFAQCTLQSLTWF